MSSYRVGIIGCGGIAHAHAKGYLARGLDIVAAADVRKERLAKFRQLYEVGNLYDDYRQMLTKEELDLVSICTWPTLHSEMTVDVAEADVKGILCEKPMATCLAEADKMIEACDKTGAQDDADEALSLFAQAEDAENQASMIRNIATYGVPIVALAAIVVFVMLRRRKGKTLP